MERVYGTMVLLICKGFFTARLDIKGSPIKRTFYGTLPNETVLWYQPTRIYRKNPLKYRLVPLDAETQKGSVRCQSCRSATCGVYL